MRVNYDDARGALERLPDGKVPGQPEVTVHLSDPDEQGISELTISGQGSFHASEETVAIAIGLALQPVIEKYTPSTVGHVVNEPARPPSAGAARGSTVPKGRVVKAMPESRPVEQADLVPANVAPKPGRARKAR